MATATKVPASIKVGGVPYRTPDEARVGAEALEADAEERADGYRENGDEAMAERVMDRAAELSDRLRLWAREREEADAAGTEQPPSRPARSPSSRKAAKPSSRSRTTRRRGGSAGGTGRAARRDVGRVVSRAGLEPYTSGTADLIWTLAGLGLGISILFLFLNEQGRGPGAVEGIAGAATRGFQRFLSPTDPFLFAKAPKHTAAVPAGSVGADVPRPGEGGKAGHFAIIGRPGEGTHSRTAAPNNWQSDNAYDVAMPVGTPLYAVTAGTLGKTGSLHEGGRFAGIRVTLDGSGNDFFYAHLSRLAPGIAEGAHVRKGQLLGYSGQANGVPHLHFAAKNGDPWAWVVATYRRARARRARGRTPAKTETFV